jgi:hypothetical protein
MTFLRAQGAELVDGDGRPVLLRGMGLGNWLLPEGYIWKFEPPGPQSPRAIEALIADLVGRDRAAEFWQGFRDTFITESDIARMAAEGMNHVRLPMNARLLSSDGFGLVDRTISWCRSHGLWVVLDLHGAPGGQTGTNIDDSLGTPALFEDARYREQTIELWRSLAERYRDEPAVAGYDLLNEPLPNEYQYTYSAELVALYRDLTKAIREIDENHLIIYEGSHWATNWSMFTEVWDPNSMLQFHRYWSPPDRPGIQKFLDTRDRLGLPIYMGEGGENNPDWLQTAFQLYEDYGISWNFWPWKKLRTRTSPCSVVAPDGWDDVVAYAAGNGPRPSPDAAWQTLLSLLDRFDIARCEWREDVMSAVARRVPRSGSLRLPASGFSFRGPGVSYRTFAAKPLPGFRPDDQVTILASSDSPAFDHTDGSPRDPADQLLVELDRDEWVAYEFTVTEPAGLTVTVGLVGAASLAGANGPAGQRSLPSVAVDDIAVPLSAAGSGTAAVSVPGRHVLRVTGTAPATQLAWLELTAPLGRNGYLHICGGVLHEYQHAA